MIACPKCGSTEHYFKVSALYENDTSNTASKTAGVGISLSGGVGVGVGSSRGTQQTLLAARLQPPERPIKPDSTAKAIALGIVTAALVATLAVASWYITAVIVGLLFGSGVLAMMGNSRAYPRQLAQYHDDLARWQRQWICRRCGEVSEP